MNSKVANDGYFNTVIATTGIFAKLVIDDIVVNDITIESLDVTGNATFGKNIILAATLGPQGITGEGQIIQGTTTLLHTFGSNNTFLGSGTKTAGNLTLTGASNVAVGGQTLSALTTGNTNVALGSSAGLGVTTGSTNIYIGASVGALNTTGSNNIYLGSSAVTGIESDIIRIGQSTVHDAAYIAGTTFMTFQQFGGDVGGGGTITGAMIAKGIVTVSGATAVIDTGANIEAAIPSLATAAGVGQVITLLISNTTGAAVDITAGGGVTIDADFQVPLKGSRLVYLLRTAAGTYTAY